MPGLLHYRPIDDIAVLPLLPPVTLRVLVVADDLVTFYSDFGIGMAIATLRTQVYGHVRFDVTLARREGATAENPGATGAQPRYTGFRFDRLEPDGTPTLHKYHQVWCFGFAPGNSGSPNDGLVGAHPLATTDAELAVLSRWMDERRGGVFATGDHHFLGASLCSRIPRVGTMRRWTNAQGVPPIGGLARIDTNRPATAGQQNIAGGNPDIIPFGAQSDHVPQRIDWKRYYSRGWLFHTTVSPHPILCDADRGVIDVMPDHPHEGRLFCDDEIDLHASFDFDGYAAAEYPTGPSGARPRPVVIAWGTTLPDPPYNHDKGDSPPKRFPMIGTYDGDGAGVGRVVVDSTWHHWMDVNLAGLAAGAPDAYAKIQTYFRNIGIWLATPTQRRRMLLVATWAGFFSIEGVEEFGAHRPVLDLGRSARDVLGRAASRCLVREWVKPYLPELLRREFVLKRPVSDPCLSCPPSEILEAAVLGGLVREMAPYIEQSRELRWAGKKGAVPDIEELELVADAGARVGLETLSELIRDGAGRAAELAEALDAKAAKLGARKAPRHDEPGALRG